MTALDGLVGRRSQTKSRLVRRLAQKDGLVQQPISAQTGPHLKVGSSWILNFTSTNYLGFGQDPRVINAAARATRNWGISLGMPRLFAHDRLTARLEKKSHGWLGSKGRLFIPRQLTLRSMLSRF